MAIPSLNKISHSFGLFILLTLVHRIGAAEFRVGAANRYWTVPTDSNGMTYNQWAEMNRFQVGDSLLFVYQPDKDLVLQVSEDDYTKCNTKAPIASFSDGNTSFKFNQSGPYYFISGMNGNCLKGEKLVVLVMADRSKRSSSISTSNTTTSTTAPSPSSTSSPPEIAPSKAHVGEIFPSPLSPPPSIYASPEIPPPTAPVGEGSPSPPSLPLSPPPPPAVAPVSSTPEMTPEIAPVGEESPSPPSSPNENGASSVVMEIMGSAGVIICSSLLFALSFFEMELFTTL